ncbi:hypothetical protein HY024_04100 [Candidatus Curtissbacteria bacterium]|nr:hypothetical protein [Candidatus Curtissbacteria bacterium]
MIKFLKLIIVSITLFLVTSTNAFAVVDPKASQNNIVGIGLLSPDAEVDEAAQLVNTNGQWGYVLLTILKDERNVDRWQKVFNDLNDRKLIPIVRLATKFDSRGFWQRPTDEDARNWADFLSKLYWPTKNRYVQIYNEVNHAQEWGGAADPSDYAKELSKTIDALKSKSQDFFVLNSPLDLALTSSTTSVEAENFYQTMESSVAGIFNKLDGWASHSYPNPDFSASPYKTGRLSILGYRWELSFIKDFTSHDLPVFITETGWRRSDTKSGLGEDTIADYYKIAFEQIWKDEDIVAVTPFVFSYDDGAFQAFSFKANEKVLGKKFYDYHEVIKNLQKVVGNPVKENIAGELEVKVPTSLINKLPEESRISVKNIGNTIWRRSENFNFQINAANAEVYDTIWSRDKVYPGENMDLKFKIKSLKSGDVPLVVEAASGNQILGKTQLTLHSDSLLSVLLKSLKSLGRSN